MKVLVVGKGGREHALGKALAESFSVEKVYAVPGNPGMEPEVQVCGGSETSESIQSLHKTHQFDLVVVGPEVPLVAGLTDQLRSLGMAVFGPDQRGAMLEGSKVFSKEFMTRYKVPTASYSIVKTAEEALNEAEKFKAPYVLKADGLAAGKGVFICQTIGELEEAAIDLFDNKILGDAGTQALIEEFQPGYELSFFVLTNGSDFVPLPMAQDHKRLQDGDQGPNTGGMGTVAPMTIAKADYDQIVEQVVRPTVVGLKEEGFDYRGVVFIGIMMTDKGPSVLEYNVRFGDPETQVLLPLLDGDWGESFLKIAKGEIPDLQWKNQFASCVVLAAENYPAAPIKDVVIHGDLSTQKDRYFLHAGTDRKQDQWLVSGGRVLNAIGLGSTLQESVQKAYDQVEKVKWPGMQYRKDIGQKALNIKK